MRKIYHLHIPKTGGRYLSEATIPFLTYDCRVSGLDTRYTLKTNHGGWRDVDDDTYIYTSIRNPIHRTISHYTFYRPYLESESVEDVKRQIFDYLYDPSNDYMNDYQSKFICSTEENVDRLLDTNFSYDLSLLDERISRINFIVKTEDLSDDYATEIYKQSCEWLGINSSQEKLIYTELEQNLFQNYMSRAVIESLTREEKLELAELNSKDWHIYNNLVNSTIRRS